MGFFVAETEKIMGNDNHKAFYILIKFNPVKNVLAIRWRICGGQTGESLVAMSSRIAGE